MTQEDVIFNLKLSIRWKVLWTEDPNIKTGGILIGKEGPISIIGTKEKSIEPSAKGVELTKTIPVIAILQVSSC